MPTGPPKRARESTRPTLIWLLLVAALVLTPVGAPARAAKPAHRVLILYSENRLFPGLEAIDATLDKSLREGLGERAELYDEFLDLESAHSLRYPDDLAEYLRRKYGAVRIDAIVAVHAPALMFLRDRRDEFLPGVPVVDVAVNDHDLRDLVLPPDFLSAAVGLEPDRTIDLALRLDPAAERVVVITGTSPGDESLGPLLHERLRAVSSRLPVEFWDGLPLEEMRSRLARLPRHAVVYLPGLHQDGAGQRLVPQEIEADLVAISAAPVYSASGDFGPDGPIGGYVAPLEDSARYAASLVTRLLRGEPASTVRSTQVPNAYVINSVQLRRFGFDETALPPGTLLRYRQPTAWEAYRWQAGGAVLLLLVQAGLITALILQLRVRHRAENDLRKTERHMRMAAAATGVGLWMHNLARGQSWANAEHRAMLGLKASEAPDPRQHMDLVHADDHAHVGAAIDHALLTGGDYDVEYRVALPNGQVRWIASRGSVELGPHREPISVRGATSDITDRMQADMEATLHRNELAHLSRVVMLGQLSGSIAHELNQPLTAILSNAQAALRFMDSESVDLETLREILRDIADDDIRAGETILRLRALFERGETRNDPIHSNALAIEVLRLLRSDLISRNIAVTTELRPDLPLIQGDRVQLQQVLFNLVFNACEAMASGSAAARVLLIRTAMAVDARHVVVSVVDGGPGIAPDQLEKIFEPFVTSKRFGVGLGLVISRNIVSAHGGRLWAFNNEGHGATFSFTIPFAEAITASRADTTSVVTPTGAREEQEQ